MNPIGDRTKRSVGGGGPLSIGPAPKLPGMNAGPLDIGAPKTKEPGTPPNLRDAEDEMKSCGSCEHFRGEEGCEKFGGYPVEADQVCDAHEGRKEEAVEMGDQASDPYEMEA